MAVPRKTLSGLAALCASMSMLAGAADAHAAIHIDSPATDGYTNDLTPAVTFSGAVPGGAVTLEADGVSAGATVADGNGEGTVTASQAVADQIRQRVGLTVRDDDGLDSVVVSVDQVPSLSGPADGTTHPAADVAFHVTGAIPGHDVVLYDDGDPVATAGADADGEVAELTPDTPLAAGEHTLTARTFDDHDVASSPESVTIDVSPPAPSFANSFDGVQLNQAQSALTFSGVDPDADKVTLYEIVDVDDVGTPVAIGDTTVVTGGVATISPTLADGRHSLVVNQTVNGVESESYDVVTAVVNTSAPLLDTSSQHALTNTVPWFHVSGALENVGDSTTSVELYIDGVLAGSDTTDGGGMAGIHPAQVPDGAHTAYVVTVDDLGHRSTVRSNEVHFTMDATAPAAPTLVSPHNGALVASATPQIVVHAEPGARVHLLIDDVQDEGFATADADGNATFTPSAALADGAHATYAFATDAAGNDSEIGTAGFTVRTAAPAAATPPTAPARPAAPVAATPPATPSTPAAPSKVTLSSHTLTKSKPVKVGFTLSKAGTVKVTITKVSKGRPTTVASVDVKVKAGKGTYTLRTKVGSKTLKKGTYKLTLQTVSGKRTSKGVAQKLTVG